MRFAANLFVIRQIWLEPDSPPPSDQWDRVD